MALAKNIKTTYDATLTPEQLVREIIEEVRAKKKFPGPA
jgi:hypothetical protein